MKNILFVVFVFIALTTKAQFGIGPKLGIDFSSDAVIFPTIDLSKSKKIFIGSTYSLSLIFGHSSVFHFQPEFYYSQIGSKYYIKDDNISYTQKRNYGGLNILFDIGYTDKKVRFYGQPGIYIALLTSGLLEIDNAGQKTYNYLHSGNSIYGDSGIPIDFGFSFGFGLEYKISNGWLSLNPRYKIGVLPHSFDSFASTAFLNKSFSFNLSYIFIIGHKA